MLNVLSAEKRAMSDLLHHLQDMQCDGVAPETIKAEFLLGLEYFGWRDLLFYAERIWALDVVAKIMNS